MTKAQPFRTSILTVGLAAILAGCGGLDYFDKAEPILPGERKSVRQVTVGEAGIGADGISLGVEQISIPAAQQNTDWPQMGGNSSRMIGHVAASASPRLAWRADAGTGSSGRVVSSPVIAAGRVYTLDSAATVSAFDASSGNRVWSVDVTPENEYAVDGFGGGLAYEGGTLYVSSGFGKLFALDANSGAVSWTGELRTPSRAAPVISDGRVYAVTRENRLFAFDAATGAELWNRQGLEQTVGILGGAAPAANDDVVIAPFSSGELNAYLAISGRPIWDQELSGASGGTGLSVFNDVAGDPVIADDVVYAASQSGRLVAIDIKSGERLWTRNLGGTNPPYIAGNALFFVTTNGDAMALSRETGETIWAQPLGAFQDPEDREDPIVWAGPVLAGGNLVLVSNDEKMVLLDPATGTLASQVELPDGVTNVPAVANGTIYMLSDGASLLAYR